MRKYDVAYVPNGPQNYYPAKDLEEMTLEEIVKKYLKTCGKANGNISICSQCKSPCREGKRAIQLLANKVYNDPPVPLYGGKTLIERAKEENMKRRGELPDNMEMLAKALDEAKKKALENNNTVTANNKTEVKKKKYVKWDGWWETSLNSGDQVKWLIDNMGISKTQARKKIYQYKYLHGMTGSSAAEKKDESLAPVVNTTMKAFEESTVSTLENAEERKNDSIENKLEILMRQQEEHKKLMEKYMDLYKIEKEKYDKIKQKTDILCSAMDILND